jgi:hypothetical protein
MLPRPPALRQPNLTQGQARRLAHIKRSGYYVTGFETVEGDNITALVIITSRTEFIMDLDGKDLDAQQSASLPARPSSGRRRSLRQHETPMVIHSQESTDAQQ